MRRICAIVLVLLLLATLAVPGFAAENEFAPSIGYKDGPEIDESEMNEEEVTPCLVITSIIQAKEKKTDISQTDRDLLLEVYEKLSQNEMQLPMEDDDYVIRELIDISWRHSDCVEEDHEHKEWLSEENTSLKVTFDTKISSDMEVAVLVYINEQWVPVTSVTHNSDDTITCVFEDICPVAICVRDKHDAPPAQTGDPMGQLIWLWVLLLVTSLAAVTVLIMNRRKFVR